MIPFCGLRTKIEMILLPSKVIKVRGENELLEQYKFGQSKALPVLHRGINTGKATERFRLH